MMDDERVRNPREERADRPGSADNALNAMSARFSWAKEARLVTRNPMLGVKRIGSAEGFHAWTDEEIAQFKSFHPIGAKLRLAFALFRYLGVRRSDAVRLGKGMQLAAVDNAGHTYEAIRFKVTK